MKKLAAALSVLVVAAPAAHAQVVVDLTATNGGFTTQNLGSGLNTWQWDAGTGWFNTGSAVTSLQRLLTPTVTATATAWGMSIVHANIFEAGDWDGGNVWMSINGGAFALITPAALYDCSLIAGPYVNMQAFCGTDASRTSTFSGAANVGDTYQFAFDLSSDISINPAGNDWTITSITYRDFNVSTVPEPSTYLLMAAGLASLGVISRRRIRNV